MDIKSLITNKNADLPPRIFLFGQEGIGKTTFGAGAPNPLFICAEDGLMGLEDSIDRVTPTGFAQLLKVIEGLESDQLGYKSIVLDTVDWLERQIHKFVCARDNEQNIEAYGYGKGYKVAELELNRLLNGLTALRQKGLCIILLGHAQIRTCAPPDAEPFDRWEPKGHKTFVGMIKEWADVCLFATRDLFRSKVNGVDRTLDGGRVVKTNWSPAFDAKNRLMLKDILELSWAAFEADLASSKLRRTFQSLLAKTTKLSPEERATWEKVNPLALSDDKLKAGIEKLK